MKKDVGVLMGGEGSGYRMPLFPRGQPVLPVDARFARAATRLGYGEKSTSARWRPAVQATASS